MENSKIEWCMHTGNLWEGCVGVHAGCDNCYAEARSHRFGSDLWGHDKPRRVVKKVWDDFKTWQRKAAEVGEIHTVFVGSLMDIGEKSMPLMDHRNVSALSYETDLLRGKFYNEVVPASPNLMFLLLSKRPSNYNKQIPRSWQETPPANVVFGTSISDQASADIMIPQLLQVKGKRFLSIEPMLGALSITNATLKNAYSVPTKFTEEGKGIEWTHPGDKFIGVDWVIVGGESGKVKRPFNPDWARTIRDECEAANVPFFMKQIDKIQSIPEDLMIREFPKFFNQNKL